MWIAAMAIATVDALLDVLARYRLLDPGQLNEIAKIKARFAEPKSLAKELLQRGWLTPYQINHLFLGQAAELVLGQYLLLERLGEGGMGQVFKARHQKLARIVAIKLIRKERLSNPTAVRRFQHEVRAAAQLNHPHVVLAYDADEVKGTHFLVMEYVEGGTDLAKIVKQHGPLPLGQACDFIRQAALGLQHAFEHGLVHRDIKPHNLIVASGQLSVASVASPSSLATRHSSLGTVKILDLGLARLDSDADNEHSTTLTQEGAVMGTPDYLAPEQAQESHTVDIRADLYSLGCTFYFLLAGRPPFAGGSMAQKITKHLHNEPPALEKFRPEVPAEVADVVRKLMAKRPEDRFQTPAELAALLASWSKVPVANLAQTVTIDEERGMKDKGLSHSSSLVPHSSSSDTATGWSSFINPGAAEQTLESVKRLRQEEHERRRKLQKVIGIVAGFAALILLAYILIPSKKPEEKADGGFDIKGNKEASREHKRPEKNVTEAWLQSVSEQAAEKRVEAVAAKLKELNPGFDGKMTHKIEDGIVTELAFTTEAVSDISPVRALTGLKQLSGKGGELQRGKLSDLSPLKGMDLKQLYVSGNRGITDLSPLKGMDLIVFNGELTQIADVSPLKGMPLTMLDLGGTPVADLSPLQGMPLTRLDVNSTKISDLSPLKGMKLTYLTCPGTQVNDLLPLKGMPLKWLFCYKTEVIDLAPLKGMPLEQVWCDFSPWRSDGEILHSLKTLKKINGKPTAEFWKDVEAQQKNFAAWVKKVQDMPAEKQKQAVADKLKELNPGFDGKVRYFEMENGVVTVLGFHTDCVSDISPVRALKGLRHLDCDATIQAGKQNVGKLPDLSPLKGMQLTYLNCTGNPISDLTPLKGMPLQHLECANPKLVDLSPLKGMPLRHLGCGGDNKIADISPLKGMPLTYLYLQGTKVESDLTPLKGMPLEFLALPPGDFWFGSYAPLRGMRLKSFEGGYPRDGDVSPLTDMPLEWIYWGTFNRWRDTEFLRSFKSLKKINEKSAAEFWKGVDAKLAPFNAWVKKVQGMPAEKQVQAVAAKLKELNRGFDGKVKHAINNGVVTEFQFLTDKVSDISPVRALKGLDQLECYGGDPVNFNNKKNAGKLADLSPLAGMKLTRFVCGNNPVSDLTPLKGMALTLFACFGSDVSDLTPLKGMPLTNLLCAYTQVSDLTPLKGMKLTNLDCGGNRISDLSPLQGMPFKVLGFNGTAVTDLAPLKGMKLEHLGCIWTQVTDLSLLKDMPLKSLWCEISPYGDNQMLRSIKTLVKINDKPATEFWKELDAKKAAVESWVKEVADLAVDNQVAAVAKKLKKLNPGFDGKVTHTVENGVVTKLKFAADQVTDISPVRALPKLTSLSCVSSEPTRGMFFDLWSLKGMSLKVLAIDWTSVWDLSPLKGMQLKSLTCYGTPVSDLSPLIGMALSELTCGGSKVSDLSPLKGMPLAVIYCNGTKISDLSALKGMKPLQILFIHDTKVADLSPLEGLKLTILNCQRTKVQELSPLKDMPLRHLGCDFQPERDAAILRAIKTLERINGKSAKEFWKEVGGSPR
jgi:serine/threonine protein kinase/Leucine-rich repeat (LRR) protein